MLLTIHNGTKRGEELRKFFLRRSHPRVATTVRRPGQGGRERPITRGSFGVSGAGRVGEVHIRQFSTIQRRKRVATTRIVKKHRRVSLESLGYDRNRPDVGLSQDEYYPRGQTNKTESETFPPGSPLDYSYRGGQSSESMFYQRGKVPLCSANVVVVPKKGSKWRVCVDYTDLNEACPKDSFPLSSIDQIVDASTGHGMLSSLYAFSRYHQIPMQPPNGEITTFITPHGLYCYNVMPFSLKNARATYQRQVTKIFQPLMGKTMEIYIDNMLVKSKERPDHMKLL